LPRALPSDEEFSEWLDYLKWKRHLPYDKWTEENEMETEERSRRQESRLTVCANTATELNTKKGIDLRALSPCKWDCCFLCGCELTPMPERESYIMNDVHVHETDSSYTARLRSVREHRWEEHLECMEKVVGAVGCKIKRLDETFHGYRLLCKTKDDDWYSLEFPDVFDSGERPMVKEGEKEPSVTRKPIIYERPVERTLTLYDSDHYD